MQDAQLISQAGLVESLASDGLVSVSAGAGQPQKNMELAKFADSLGSSVPLQQTSEQVSITGLYARTSDGKMVELTKESVASVMGKLLYGADTLAGLVSGLTQNLGNSTVTSETVDSAVKTGSYGHGRELFEGGNYGVLLVFNNVAYNYIAQIDISANKNTFYRFGLKNDTGYSWTEWRSDNFGFNTLAELSSGVAEQMGFAMNGMDANSLPTGFYSTVGSNNTNLPSGMGYGVLLSFDCGNGRRKLQMAYAVDKSKLYIRNCEIGNWGDWTEV